MVVSRYTNAKTLITGSSGFLGSHLTTALMDTGAHITEMNRRIRRGSESSQLTFGDITNLDDTFDYVFHLAGHVPVGVSAYYSRELIDANILLTANLIARMPSARFVFSSSVSVYGTPQYLPIDENHPFAKPEPYGMSKLAAETVVRSHSNSVILRFSSVYGPRMRPSTIVPRFILQALEHGTITVFGDGSRLQDYLFVEDAIDYLLRAGLISQSETFNAVSGQSVTNEDLAALIARIVPGCQIQHVGEDTTPSCAYSTARWHQVNKPAARQTNLESGLIQTVMYLSH